MQKTITSLLVVGILVAGGWYLYSKNNKSAEQVAVVNGESISRAELSAIESQLAAQRGVSVDSLDTEARSVLETQALDALISRTLIKQAVLNSDITVSEEAIDERKTALSSQFENEEAFLAAMASAGLTDETLEDEISTDLKVEAYLMETLSLADVTATNAEINTTYQQGIAEVENPPLLTDVRDQVERLVIEQKQQALIAAHLQELRDKAEIEILI